MASIPVIGGADCGLLIIIDNDPAGRKAARAVGRRRFKAAMRVEKMGEVVEVGGQSYELVGTETKTIRTLRWRERCRICGVLFETSEKGKPGTHNCAAHRGARAVVSAVEKLGQAENNDPQSSDSHRGVHCARSNEIASAESL
jgi:hypothetical protein